MTATATAKTVIVLMTALLALSLHVHASKVELGKLLVRLRVVPEERVLPTYPTS